MTNSIDRVARLGLAALIALSIAACAQKEPAAGAENSTAAKAAASAPVKSEGRGAPLAHDPRITGVTQPGPGSSQQDVADYLRKTSANLVGPQRQRLRIPGVGSGPGAPGAPRPPGAPPGPPPPGSTPPPPAGEVIEMGSAWHGKVPEGIEPLKVDLYTSKDFYKDKELWSDKRYFRCSSMYGVESSRGSNGPALVDKNDPKTAPWGYCDRDLPREALISPYKFKTAQEHYAKLMEEAKTRGGPDHHTYATVPSDWTGRYGVEFRNGDWYASMGYNQIPTLLSVLTPEYQKRVVQMLYHEAVSSAAQWPSQYCWPEGFMRRFDPVAIQPQINPHFFIVTPKLVNISTGVARNFITNINIDKEFKMDGAVPRLGADVPRWYGETIGFWDKDALITWTSNIQGWMVHGKFEFSSKLQTIEVYTPERDAAGKITAMIHEAIFYDPEAFVEPLRIVRRMPRMGDIEEGNPYAFIECVPNIYPVKGHSTPVTPGDKITYEVPDIYGRPWAHNWEEYYEKGMKRPDESEGLFNFN